MSDEVEALRARLLAERERRAEEQARLAAEAEQQALAEKAEFEARMTRRFRNLPPVVKRKERGQSSFQFSLALQRMADNDLSGAAGLLVDLLLTARESGDKQLEANVLQSQGILGTKTHKWREARWALEAAWTLFAELGNVYGEANTAQTLGAVHMRLNDLTAAREALDQVV